MTQVNEFLKQFGQTLKSSRKSMGLSQVSAAQAMHIDYRHYQNIEGGKINLRLDTLMKLVDFYGMSNNQKEFSLQSLLRILDLPTDQPAPATSWHSLSEYFVEGGHAGYLVVNRREPSIVDVNAKMASTLYFEAPTDLIGRNLQDFISQESWGRIAKFAEDGRHHDVSQPFIVSFRNKSGHLIPMMAVARVRTASDNGQVECIFFDRQTLMDEGHRLNEILSEFRQLMELYPQLRAV
ncbi:MAG: helix-turn-helix domain-containing protein [Bdellovibrionales bacterium]